jgi:hypothetical protein
VKLISFFLGPIYSDIFNYKFGNFSQNINHNDLAPAKRIPEQAALMVNGKRR